MSSSGGGGNGWEVMKKIKEFQGKFGQVKEYKGIFWGISWGGGGLRDISAPHVKT